MGLQGKAILVPPKSIETGIIIFISDSTPVFPIILFSVTWYPFPRIRKINNLPYKPPNTSWGAVFGPPSKKLYNPNTKPQKVYLGCLGICVSPFPCWTLIGFPLDFWSPPSGPRVGSLRQTRQPEIKVSKNQDVYTLPKTTTEKDKYRLIFEGLRIIFHTSSSPKKKALDW